MRRLATRSSPLLAAVALALILPGCSGDESLGSGAEIPRAGPSDRPARPLGGFWTFLLDSFLDLNAAIGSDSGYVAMFARDGQVVHAAAAGYADIETGAPMRLDTRFRLASLTKPVTATAALILVEEGRLGLDDPVERYVPAAAELRVAVRRDREADGSFWTVPLTRPLTVRDLLHFRSGIGGDADPSDLGAAWAERDIYAGAGSLEVRVDRILGTPLFEQPGTAWRYGWSADVLARVVEVAAGEPLDRFVSRRILEPLGMTSTEYLSPDLDPNGLATLYTQDEDRNLVRVDRSVRDAQEWTSGGGGLVSTAPDVMRFGLMLWNGGEYDGVRILSREMVEDMARPHVPSGVLAGRGIDGQGWGLGLAVVVDEDATPTFDRTGDFWWSGYLGTTMFVSPSTDLVGVVLSQNEPSEHSRLPYAIYLAPAFAFQGL